MYYRSKKQYTYTTIPNIFSNISFFSCFSLSLLICAYLKIYIYDSTLNGYHIYVIIRMQNERIMKNVKNNRQ